MAPKKNFDALADHGRRAGLRPEGVQAVRDELGRLGVPDDDPSVAPQLVAARALGERLSEFRTGIEETGSEFERRLASASLGSEQRLQLTAENITRAAGQLGSQLLNVKSTSEKIKDQAVAEVAKNAKSITNEISKALRCFTWVA